jgi:hypothetical protein
MFYVFYVSFTVHLDICISWNQLEALFIFSLFRHYTSTCFGLASCPSSGGNNVHVCMQQVVRVVRFSWLSAGLVGPADSHLQPTTRTTCCIHTLLPPDDGHLASCCVMPAEKNKGYVKLTNVCGIMFLVFKNSFPGYEIYSRSLIFKAHFQPV